LFVRGYAHVFVANVTLPLTNYMNQVCEIGALLSNFANVFTKHLQMFSVTFLRLLCFFLFFLYVYLNVCFICGCGVVV